MLSGCADIGHNLQEAISAGFCPKATGDLCLDLDHAKIALRLVETAKANGLKPYEYLKYLLTEIPKHIEDKNAHKAYLDNLLPWSENLPDICKKQT